LAALTIASAASTMAGKLRHSIIPNASDIELLLKIGP
jgi:hypothetical protein